jgi:hypothetical protein
MLVQRDTDQFAMGAGVSQLASPFRGFDGEQQSLNEWEEADEWTSEADLEEALEDEWEGDTEFEEEAAWQSGTESETAVEDTEAEAEASQAPAELPEFSRKRRRSDGLPVSHRLTSTACVCPIRRM